MQRCTVPTFTEMCLALLFIPLLSIYTLFIHWNPGWLSKLFLIPTILFVTQSNQKRMFLTCLMCFNIALVSKDVLCISSIIQNSYLQTSEDLTQSTRQWTDRKYLLCIYMILREYLHTNCHLRVFIYRAFVIWLVAILMLCGQTMTRCRLGLQVPPASQDKSSDKLIVISGSATS